MQSIPQAHYHWIPRANWWRFHTIIHNQMEYNMDFSEVRMPCDVNISYINQKENSGQNLLQYSQCPRLGRFLPIFYSIVLV